MAECPSCTSNQASANELADPGFRRILWLALVANLTMFVVEIVASALSGSVSLQADALDFLGDTVNYGITLFVLSLSVQARSKAALFKGATMAVFGVWVIGNATYEATVGELPDAMVMGSIGMLALVVNAGVAVMLFRYRSGDSNMRSIWLCSRNDALGNIAVMLAASGVFVTATVWPDILVAAVIAGLNISAACQVLRKATGELRSAQIQESTLPNEP